MENTWIFASLGCLLLLAEIFLGTQFFLFFIAIAFYLQALTVYLLDPISSELSLFFIALYSTICPLAWFYFVKPVMKNNEQPDVNHALGGLKGYTFTLDKEMSNSRAKISIKHSLWDIRTLDEKNYSKGTKLEVISIEGVTLIVKKVEDNPQETSES